MPNGGHYSRKTQMRTDPSWPAKKRRLERGAKKLAAKHERSIKRTTRISLHPQLLTSGASSVDPDPTIASGPVIDTETVNPPQETAA